MKTQNIQHDTPRMDSQFRVPSSQFPVRRPPFRVPRSAFRVGFTLVELLVVVTIIVVLVAILMPAARRANELSRLTSCASNVRQWGTALLSSSSDNFGVFRSTYLNLGGRYPNNVWINDANANSGGTMNWSLEHLSRYIPGADFTNHRLGNIWYCPELDATKMGIHDQNFWTNGLGAMNTQYSFYTGADFWGAGERTTTARNELCESRPGSSSRVMVGDVLYSWTFGGWGYNHGEAGYSLHQTNWGSYTDYGPPKITGVNRCYGDGSVRWNDGSNYDTTKMQAFNASLGWVRGGASDTNFY